MFFAKGFCYQRVNCQWGPFGSWSACDGCTNLQTRSRPMAVYAQFGGNPCYGERTETRSCETTQACPLEDGCGDRFRCRSGQCISRSLMCNGDQDCEEDALDESQCPIDKHLICEETALPPNIDLLGLGFDVVTGKTRASVINTKSFGGQCRKIFSGVHRNFYRLPLSTIQYTFLVKAQNDFRDEIFSSKWEYTKDVVNREKVSGTTTGFHNYDYHEKHTIDKNKRLLILKNDIEVAQFQSNSPRYLPIAEEFWKALAKLPSVYDYSAYRKVLVKFGTHYLSEGSLGGSLRVFATLDEESEHRLVTESRQFEECERTKRWILFFPIYIEKCSRDRDEKKNERNNYRKSNPARVYPVGGGGPQITALMNMPLDDIDSNWRMYSDWADSIGSFPAITKQKLRPLSELVKEVQCAGLKKLYLRRAIEEYLAESHPCHCRPCHNNGLAVMDGDRCKCICKPLTEGEACEQGTEVEGQPGVIHGSWSCWSSWSSCFSDRRSRTRSCSNPYPRNGGQHCIGEATEMSDCEDQELLYLKTMEPQCFDHTLPASQKCEPPPALINGYILDPKDIYLVGTKVEYTCIDGYYLVGHSKLECTPSQTWSSRQGVCTRQRCKIDSLADHVIASPLKEAYAIGEAVTLSCPKGRQLLGEATVICDPSLNFSPNPADTTCSQDSSSQQQVVPSVQCQLWEKSSRGKCVCKMPSECGSSLELCATPSIGGTSIRVTVCKMHALQCLGKDFMIAEDSTCEVTQPSTAGCTNCHMWEDCDDQTNQCRCKDSASCLNPGINVCVHIGEDETAAPQTMSECEAGLRRCKGEKVSVVSILPCVS
ncbi:complement component C7 [Pholidichthys leucotaenia]